MDTAGRRALLCDEFLLRSCFFYLAFIRSPDDSRRALCFTAVCCYIYRTS